MIPNWQSKKNKSNKQIKNLEHIGVGRGVNHSVLGHDVLTSAKLLFIIIDL